MKQKNANAPEPKGIICPHCGEDPMAIGSSTMSAGQLDCVNFYCAGCRTYLTTHIIRIRPNPSQIARPNIVDPKFRRN